MAEKHYTFLKANRVENTLVFAEQNDELAQRICSEQGYDQAIWLDDAATPARWSTYDGKTFTPPTDDYLISIGILTPSNSIPAE
jgi:hypothetical protein